MDQLQPEQQALDADRAGAEAANVHTEAGRREPGHPPPSRSRQVRDTLAGGWHDLPSVFARVTVPLRNRLAAGGQAVVRRARPVAVTFRTRLRWSR